MDDDTPLMKERLKIELPECGCLVGTGIMNSKEGYLVCSGLTHTTWVPQLFTPTELLDKIIEDNQGNFVQYWGFSGGLGPVTFAAEAMELAPGEFRRVNQAATMQPQRLG